MTVGNGLILIAGTNGEIGQAVMDQFTARFHQLVGFDRKASDPTPAPGCTHIAVKMASDDSVRGGLGILHEHHGARIASVSILPPTRICSAGRARSTTKSRCRGPSVCGASCRRPAT